MATDFTIKQGDTLPALNASLKDSSGNAVDLTGATILFRMRKVGAASLTVEAAAVVVSASGGTVRYNWQAGDTAVPGSYEAEFRCTLPAGIETIPNANNIAIEVVASV